MSEEASDPARRRKDLLAIAAAGVAAAALAVYWTRGLPRTPSLGWDESMHAALPAERMLLALKRGELRLACDALLGCSQYPFVYPAVLAAVQAVFGAGEATCRATGTVLWCATLFGLFRLVRDLARGERGGALAPWIAMAFAALSPMALAFSGTLFLEVPFACASVFALRAWLRRRSNPGACSELAAGAWVAACLFTKFNYGAMLALGLALDWLASARGGGSGFARRSALLALVPAAAILWWFVLPVPGGFDDGLAHRRAFLDYLASNQGFPRVAFSWRALYASAWLAWTPRLFALIVLSAAAAVPLALRPPGRAVLLVALAMAVPVLVHPFFLDRFLIPAAVPLWALAGLGLSRILPEPRALRTAVLAGLAALACVYPSRASVRAADLLVGLSPEPRTRAYQEDVYRSWPDLSVARPLPTAGLPRPESDRLLDVVAREAGPAERIGWIGISPELSPAALHLGLLDRDGSVERFLRDAAAPVDVDPFGRDPGWSDAQLLEFASRFDVIFATEPPDLKNRTGRVWTRGYRERLSSSLGWEVRSVGNLSITRPMQEPLPVTILACRPKR